MMPTFPSPSLKFRTAGFPQYGFKASLSDRACPTDITVKPAPGMPAPSASLPRPFARVRAGGATWHCVQITPRLNVPVREALAPLPQASLAPVRVVLSRSIIAYYDPIRRPRRHAGISRPCRLYPAPSLCGSASATRETFPTFPPALSLRAVDPTPAGPRPRPVVLGPRCQASSCYDRVATHETRLCQQSSTGNVFRRCIVRVMLRPACWPGPPDWLRRPQILLRRRKDL
jgi:hypothetical protein